MPQRLTAQDSSRETRGLDLPSFRKYSYNSWVVVRELKVSYHNGYVYVYIYIYTFMVNNTVCPVY